VDLALQQALASVVSSHVVPAQYALVTLNVVASEHVMEAQLCFASQHKFSLGLQVFAAQ